MWPFPILPPPIFKPLLSFFSGSKSSKTSSRSKSSGKGGGMSFANEKGGSSGQTDLIRSGRGVTGVDWIDASGLVQAANMFRPGDVGKFLKANTAEKVKIVLEKVSDGNAKSTNLTEKIVGSTSPDPLTKKDNDTTVSRVSLETIVHSPNDDPNSSGSAFVEPGNKTFTINKDKIDSLDNALDKQNSSTMQKVDNLLTNEINKKKRN